MQAARSKVWPLGEFWRSVLGRQHKAQALTHVECQGNVPAASPARASAGPVTGLGCNAHPGLLWRWTLVPYCPKCVPGHPGVSQAIPGQGFRVSLAWDCERDWSGTALRGPATLQAASDLSRALHPLGILARELAVGAGSIRM